MRAELIQLSEIDRGKRYRENYEDIPSLAYDIEERGLIQPIAVWANNGRYLLLAGGRRLKAHEVLKREEIMCRIYDRELNELEIRAIELSENINRKDLSYIEKINLEREIHELYTKLHGPKVSTSPDAPGHSLADTAKLLNKTPASLTIDMQISKAMDDFPELQWDKFKNKSDALKVVKKINTSINRMECAAVAEREIGTGDVKKKKLYDAFVVGDFFEHSPSLPNNYFDICEVDPPYSIDLQRKKKGYSYEGYNEIPFEDYEEFTRKTLKTCYNKMAENSWLIYWFGPDPWFQPIGQAIKNAGFKTTGLVGLWVKGEDKDGLVESAPGQTHMPNSRLANGYEMFYYAWKGSPCLSRPGQSNVFGYRPVPPGQKSHPTERPEELLTDVLSTFGIEGSRVLVPFAGSGNTLVASAKLNMVPIGFDLTGAYKDAYILRVNDEF